jgi:uncharacterized protein YbbC (DUF1343 family)
MTPVVTGLEVLSADPAPIAGRRWALLANHAAVTAALDPARVVLSRAAGAPSLLFAPEHGLDGVAQDMEAVADDHDGLTGVPVRSLYGRSAQTLGPRAEDLRDLEVIVVDLPDIGSRCYTFAASMDALMAGCAETGVEVLVLDRPNPIGGVRREGGPVEAGFESFVSQIPTPVRHGLTLGEIALLLQRDRYPRLGLGVVTCRSWRRSSWLDEAGLPWVPPSPNMPTLETAAIYPGLCLVEATTLSEGRGTTRPFHLVGAPWADAGATVAALRTRGLPGIAFRATRFRPQFGKHAGRVCDGVEIHVTDRLALEPVALGLELVRAFHDLHPDAFAWRAEPYEFVSDVPALDLITGSPEARGCIEAGTTFNDLFDRWRESVTGFEATLDGILLYHEPG